MKRSVFILSIILLSISNWGSASEISDVDFKSETIKPFFCSLNETKSGAANVIGNQIDYWDLNENKSLINNSNLKDNRAVITFDKSIQKNVFKVSLVSPQYWSHGVRLNVNSAVTDNNMLTLRMKFGKQYLTNTETLEKDETSNEFEVLVHVGGIAEGETKVVYSDAWYTFKWKPSRTYTDYSGSIEDAISSWEGLTGKMMKTLSYIQLTFINIKKVSYVGDYFIESAKYGGGKVGSRYKKYDKGKRSTNDAVIIGKQKYPHSFKFEGNPLSRINGAGDPDVQVWDGVVYVYTSQDRNLDSIKHKHQYDAMDGYHVFSSKDMVNWTNHGEIFHSSDVEWGWHKGGFLWAPGSARKNGKYYLYYPLKDKSGKWCVGVAVADTPIGPFKDSGKPIAGLSGIDPKVFVDDDGEAYIYNNAFIVAKLKPNMLELAEPVRVIDYAPQSVLDDETLHFCEGSYMHKKDGKYYYSYSNFNNKINQGFYAIGDSPYGPFEWKGAMAPAPQGAQDHHSIIEFKGQWYYFYHVSLPNFPKYKESQGRIVCFDKLYYNEDGTIKMVNHTMNTPLE